MSECRKIVYTTEEIKDQMEFYVKHGICDSSLEELFKAFENSLEFKGNKIEDKEKIYHNIEIIQEYIDKLLKENSINYKEDISNVINSLCYIISRILKLLLL